MSRFEWTSTAGLALAAKEPATKPVRVPPSPFTKSKSLTWRTKAEGQPCERGETAESTGCIPAGPETPKVKPSPFAKDRTQTKEFKEWFGDSKVVDEDGKPLVVYHGTDAEFEEFARSGSAHTKLLGIDTYFFTPNKAVASTYTTRGKGKLIGAYVSLKNPLIIDANGREWIDSLGDIQDQLITYAGPKEKEWRAGTNAILDKYDPDEVEYNYDETVSPEDKKALKKLQDAVVTERVAIRKNLNLKPTDPTPVWEIEQDGIIIRNSLDMTAQGVNEDLIEAGGYNPFGDIYVAFKPNQIKSVDNAGTFDPKSNNINKSMTWETKDLVDAKKPPKPAAPKPAPAAQKPAPAPKPAPAVKAPVAAPKVAPSPFKAKEPPKPAVPEAAPAPEAKPAAPTPDAPTAEPAEAPTAEPEGYEQTPAEQPNTTNLDADTQKADEEPQADAQEGPQDAPGTPKGDEGGGDVAERSKDSLGREMCFSKEGTHVPCGGAGAEPADGEAPIGPEQKQREHWEKLAAEQGVTLPKDIPLDQAAAMVQGKPLPKNAEEAAAANQQDPEQQKLKQQFDQDWGKIAEGHIDDIENAAPMKHEYTAEEVAAEQEWHTQYMDWRKQGGNTDSPANVARFMGGLGNPKVGNPDYVNKLIQSIGGKPGVLNAVGGMVAAFLRGLLGKDLVDPIAELSSLMFGEHAVPVAAAMKAKAEGWDDARFKEELKKARGERMESLKTKEQELEQAKNRFKETGDPADRDAAEELQNDVDRLGWDVEKPEAPKVDESPFAKEKEQAKLAKQKEKEEKDNARKEERAAKESERKERQWQKEADAAEKAERQNVQNPATFKRVANISSPSQEVARIEELGGENIDSPEWDELVKHPEKRAEMLSDAIDKFMSKHGLERTDNPKADWNKIKAKLWELKQPGTKLKQEAGTASQAPGANAKERVRKASDRGNVIASNQARETPEQKAERQQKHREKIQARRAKHSKNSGKFWAREADKLLSGAGLEKDRQKEGKQAYAEAEKLALDRGKDQAQASEYATSVVQAFVSRHRGKSMTWQAKDLFPKCPICGKREVVKAVHGDCLTCPACDVFFDGRLTKDVPRPNTKPKDPHKERTTESLMVRTKEMKGDCSWVTLESGTHVCLDGSGKVTKGPTSLEGKEPSQPKVPPSPFKPKMTPHEVQAKLDKMSPDQQKQAWSNYTTAKKTGGQEAANEALERFVTDNKPEKYKPTPKEKAPEKKAPQQAAQAIDMGNWKVPEQVASDSAALLKNMSYEQRASIKDYTRSSYIKVNSQMRRCPPKFECLGQAQQVILKAIEDAIDKVPEFKEPAKVFRGMILEDDVAKGLLDAARNSMKSGSTFSMPSVTSTTFDPSVALQGFGDENEAEEGYQALAFQIKAKKGLCVDSISKNESELIMSSKAKYKVAAVEETDVISPEFGDSSRMIIYLEEV